jgi:NhaP-type Na+/H+ or K+/H+ antiporter
VIIALMGAGLKLDRKIGWKSWSSTWRLLALAMPLTIAATALLGWWWLGLAPAAALLLGSALAPTDPVLAADVQVGEPGGDEDGEDEVRFALTSEAGLNDALAFPFVYAAIHLAAAGHRRRLLDRRVGAVRRAGQAVGGRARGGAGRPAARGPVLPGPLGEAAARRARRGVRRAGGDVPGLRDHRGGGRLRLPRGVHLRRSIRASERGHEYHQVLHDFVEQIERLLTVLLLVLFGGAVVRGLLAPLTWQTVLLAVAVVVVVRPLTAWLALRGGPGSEREKFAIAAFGIRGIGSFYYLAYATAEVGFAGVEQVWAAAGLIVVVSWWCTAWRPPRS